VGAGNPGGTDYLNSGMNQYTTQLGNYNAQQAGQSAMYGGLLNAGVSALGTNAGSQFMNWVGGLFS
jgi:hypothetical protein